LELPGALSVFGLSANQTKHHSDSYNLRLAQGIPLFFLRSMKNFTINEDSFAQFGKTLRDIQGIARKE